MTYCRNEIELEAHERRQEELEQREKELLRNWPLSEFMPQAQEHMWQHTDYEFLVSIIDERPDEVLGIICSEPKEGDEDSVKKFMNEWLNNEAQRLQAAFIERELNS